MGLNNVILYDEIPEVMNSKEASIFLRMSYNDFLIKCREGLIPHFTLTDGPRKQRTPIFCRRSTLEEWMSEKEKASVRKAPFKIVRMLK